MLSGDHKFRWTKALPAFNKLSDPENHQPHGRYKHMPGKQKHYEKSDKYLSTLVSRRDHKQSSWQAPGDRRGQLY